MTPSRRATDRVPDHTPPWWVSIVLLAVMLAPLVVSLATGAR